MYRKYNLQKKGLMCLTLTYQSFLVQKIFLKKMCNRNNFCKTLPFWLLKTISLFNLLKILVEACCNAFMFKSCVSIKKNVFTRVLLDLVEKIKQEYILPKLKHYYSTRTSFYLWMSKVAHDVFALVISFSIENQLASTYYNKIV
jgi:hypothetical protein